MTWSPDGKTIVLGNRLDKVIWVDVEEQRIVHREENTKEVRSACSALTSPPLPSSLWFGARADVCMGAANSLSIKITADERNPLLPQWLPPLHRRRRSSADQRSSLERPGLYDQHVREDVGADAGFGSEGEVRLPFSTFTLRLHMTEAGTDRF